MALMSDGQLSDYRSKCRERKRLSRQRLKLSQLNDSVSDEPTSSRSPYVTPNMLGKAVKRAKVALPFLPRKKREVIRALVSEYGVSEVTNRDVGFLQRRRTMWLIFT